MYESFRNTLDMLLFLREKVNEKLKTHPVTSLFNGSYAKDPTEGGIGITRPAFDNFMNHRATDYHHTMTFYIVEKIANWVRVEILF